MKSLLVPILILVGLAVSHPVKAESDADKERAAILKSNPDLAKVMSGPCKSVDAAKLSKDYIIRGSDLKSDQDKPGSRLWMFSNLNNDIATANAKKPKDEANLSCLTNLRAAGAKEQLQYWISRGVIASCEKAPPPDPKECNWVDDNVKYALKQNAKANSPASDAAPHEAFRKAEHGLEACTTCKDDKKTTDVADVAAKAVDKACCDVFRQRDGELSEKQCTDLHTGSQRLDDRIWGLSCGKDFAMGAIKGIWSSLKSLVTVPFDLLKLSAKGFKAAWDWGWGKEIDNDSIYSGFGTLAQELQKNPGKAGMRVAEAIMQTFTGHNQDYWNCLHESQRGKYICANLGTFTSQVGMLSGGWLAVLKILQAGKVAIAASSAAKAISPALTGTAAKLGKIAKAVMGSTKAGAEAETAADAEAVAAGGLRGARLDSPAGNLITSNPNLLAAKKALYKLEAEKSKLTTSIKSGSLNSAEAETAGKALAQIESEIARTKDLQRTLAASVKSTDSVESLEAAKKYLSSLPTKANPELQAEIAAQIAIKDQQIAAATTRAADEAAAVAAKAGTKAATQVETAAAASKASPELVSAQKALRAAQERKRYWAKKPETAATKAANMAAADKSIQDSKALIQSLRVKATTEAASDAASAGAKATAAAATGASDAANATKAADAVATTAATEAELNAARETLIAAQLQKKNLLKSLDASGDEATRVAISQQIAAANKQVNEAGAALKALLPVRTAVTSAASDATATAAATTGKAVQAAQVAQGSGRLYNTAKSAGQVVGSLKRKFSDFKKPYDKFVAELRENKANVEKIGAELKPLKTKLAEEKAALGKLNKFTEKEKFQALSKQRAETQIAIDTLKAQQQALKAERVTRRNAYRLWLGGKLKRYSVGFTAIALESIVNNPPDGDDSEVDDAHDAVDAAKAGKGDFDDSKPASGLPTLPAPKAAPAAASAPAAAAPAAAPRKVVPPAPAPPAAAPAAPAAPAPAAPAQ